MIRSGVQERKKELEKKLEMLKRFFEEFSISFSEIIYEGDNSSEYENDSKENQLKIHQ